VEIDTQAVTVVHSTSGQVVPVHIVEIVISMHVLVLVMQVV